MAEPPGTIPETIHGRSSHHPRRPPAHKSVSLRQPLPAIDWSASKIQDPAATTASSPTAPASDKANPPSTVSPKLADQKQSSGESSDAGKWFDNSNNAVRSNASFADNDPPFFLRNSSSSSTPPDGQDSRPHPHAKPVSYRPTLAHFGTDGSGSEDFRSVIDDLTIANKRLKQKLRKYETLYDAHLQDEKLFEVRFHGLADHKKLELEETLRKFAASLDDTRSEYPPISSAPALDAQKTQSSMSRFAESGYVSMSASGQNSSSHAPSGADSDRRKMSRSQFNQQQQNVHSYLHDIPPGLFPMQNVPMTDKSKKKLVVRRLEQVFAGKRSTPGNHAQPMQQEEVAQSAAMADRKEKEASGQLARREGHREARIMPEQLDEDDIVMRDMPESLSKFRPFLGVSEHDFAHGSGSPDQRPTRPLDLDPYRAQVPAENMEYIRHLGFTPPNMVSGDSPEDGHGWIYLNLLINMAQLHTINVTPDYVKEAVSGYSSMLELSLDGRKIRWKGGRDLTRDSSGSSSERLSGSSPYDGVTGSSSKSPTKRIQTGYSGSSESINPERKARRTARAMKERDQNKYAYNPIFYHKDDSEDEDDFYNNDATSLPNSLLHVQTRGDSSGFASSAMRSSSSRRKRDDGPMIFYNKAKFCTDLSGDRNGSSLTNYASYKSITSQPLGAPQPLATDKGSSDRRRPGNILDTDVLPMKDPLEPNTSSEEDFEFAPDALRNDTGDVSPEVMDFEMSGLGGVEPDDNFAIRVKRSQVRTGCSSQATASRKSKQSQLYTRKILEALKEQPSFEDESSKPTIIKEEILSASRKDLPSSSLPPASYLPFDSTSCGDVDSDLDSDVSSGPSSSGSSDRGPATALQMLNISPTGGTPQMANESEPEEEDDSDSDQSVDLLATARQIDPKSIRAKEREYDAAIADRLAEEIPAGSSAATAGGGSGFNTPASVPPMGEDGGRMRSSSGSASTRTKILKRARTNDSIATTLQQKSGKSQRVD